MTRKGWMDWLGRRRVELPADDGLAELLEQSGVPRPAIVQASHHRFLLRTRLASTLVSEGEIGESAAVETLCRHVGLPGLCLQRSVVDLATVKLPEAFALEQLLLPVRQDETGAVLVACADPPTEAAQQELALLLGKPVRPHVALEMYLRRAVLAAFSLRRDCPDAVHLLGHEVEVANVTEPGNHLAIVMPPTEVPAYRSAEAVQRQPWALVGMVASDHRSRVEQSLAELGLAVTTVDNGSEALRLVAKAPPAVLVLEACLPGRGGLEIMGRLGSAQRYRQTHKVLVWPERWAGAAPAGEGLADNLVVVVPSQLQQEMEKVGAGFDPTCAPPGGEPPKAARAMLYRALALHQEGSLEAAKEQLNEALGLEPLLGEVHCELARIKDDEHAVHDAALEYSVAVDLGVAEPADVARLAELVQAQGELARASTLWSQAGAMFGDEEVAQRLREHGKALSRDRDSGEGMP